MARTRSEIIIADDHPLVRGALRQAVEGAFQQANVTETSDFDALIAALGAQAETDLVLLDLSMPGMQGFSGLIYLRGQYPSVPVVVVSANDNRGVMRRCMQLGAAGFIPKTTSLDAMTGAIATVLAGGVWLPPDLDPDVESDPTTTDILRRLASLTPQQMRVLMMLSEGLLNKQIAYELSVSEATIKAHVSAILQKLKVDSRTQAVIAAGKVGPDQLVSVSAD
ncbi:MAG TPA: response regulator transcription factor [Methylovirgula sp.]|nr:response regulator transcription factor [Methylovirgula sp.]